MKSKIIYTFLGLAAFVLITMSNSSGRATQSGLGGTTAPGDGSACTSCHSGGNFGTAVHLSLLDKVSGASVTEYTPGVTYSVGVAITTSTAPAGHGFQVIALLDSDSSAINTWANSFSVNTKLTSAGGRQYFEHSSLVSENNFDAEWTAPASGSGSVTFYAAGNAVNGDGQTGGDEAVTNSFTFQENTTSTEGLAKLGISLNAFPNPTVENLTLTLDADEAKDLMINIYNIEGQKLHNQNVVAQNGNNRFEFNVADYATGVYFVEITDGVNRTSIRFVKY